MSEETFDQEFVQDVIEFEGTKELQASDWAEKNLGKKTYVDGKFIPYKDTDGSWIIGYGTKIEDAEYEHYVDGITEEEALGLMHTKLADARNQASSLISNYHSQPEDIQEVLTDLTYNMGVGTLGEDFTGFLTAIENKNYPMAMAQLKFIDPVGAGMPLNDIGTILTGDELGALSSYYTTQTSRSIHNLEKIEDAYIQSRNTETDDGVFNVLRDMDEFAE